MQNDANVILQQQNDFTLWGIMKDAWHKVYGSKKVLLAAYLIYMAAYMASLLIQVANEHFKIIPYFNMVFPALWNIVIQLPLSVGLLFMGIYRASNRPISAKFIFNYFSWRNILKILVYVLWLVVIFLPLIVLGALLFVLPIFEGYVFQKIVIAVILGMFIIYLFVGYLMALPLMFEKNITPGAALTMARKNNKPHWFKIFGYLIVSALAFGVGGLTLGIALIWLLPWIYILYGEIYIHIFGVENNYVRT